MSQDEILLKSNKVYDAPERVKEKAHIKEDGFEVLYRDSIDDPDLFWSTLAEKELHWFKKWDKDFEWDFPYYKWFVNGKINITYNCLDRHVQNGRRNKVAYIYTNEAGEEQKITYGELYEKVCRFANGLKSLGIGKGDLVTIYMPLTIEQIIAMLACARIGAIHSVVFAGFSARALRTRIEDADAKAVITTSWSYRKGGRMALKPIVDEAIKGLSSVKHVIIDQRGDRGKLAQKEVDFYQLLKGQSAECPAAELDSEDILYTLYTSGTTGKPKGVVHTHGGYNLFTHYSTKVTFDIHEDDIFWCTADTGWVTGHSYTVYGPLSVGVSSVIYEGAPVYPDAGIWWSIVERYRVNSFYTAPTAIRMFMRLGEEYPSQYDLSSLRIIGTVGEPINPEAWVWYYETIGKSRCAVVDTWWQTETGGHMILSLPSCRQKPGKAGRPFFGIQAEVVDSKGNPIEPNKEGYLVIRRPWPGALRDCWKQTDRFKEYWNEIEGSYFPGDVATIDEDGFIMILGRSDDVLNVSGHRIGTAEVESALVSHASVAEAAVIGKPDEVKGQAIKGFVIIKKDKKASDGLVDELKTHVKKELGALAVPAEIDVVDQLPKTRSGKIMRRVLKARELGEDEGDTSTLAD